MICVADGVTTKTFWPERASRIACLVAYECVRDHVTRGRGNSPNEIECLIGELRTALVKAFEADRQRLIAVGARPHGWSSRIFERHRDTLGYWYNSTLLLAALGRNGGIAIWTGDGAIVRFRRLKNGAEGLEQPLRSGPDGRVYNVASLGGPIQFSAARIEAPETLSELRLALVTDGVERTSQNNGANLCDWVAPMFGSNGGGAALLEALIGAASSPGAEPDNHSAAMLDWGGVSRTIDPLAEPCERDLSHIARARPRRRTPAKQLRPLSASQQKDLLALARSRLIDDKWLAAFIVARCGDDDAQISMLVEMILTAGPRRESLPGEVLSARRRPATSRRALDDLVRDIGRLARLLERGE
jgi:hypothetical protein